jgi:hypothetical protein
MSESRPASPRSCWIRSPDDARVLNLHRFGFSCRCMPGGPARLLRRRTLHHCEAPTSRSCRFARTPHEEKIRTIGRRDQSVAHIPVQRSGRAGGDVDCPSGDGFDRQSPFSTMKTVGSATNDSRIPYPGWRPSARPSILVMNESQTLRFAVHYAARSAAARSSRRGRPQPPGSRYRRMKWTRIDGGHYHLWPVLPMPPVFAKNSGAQFVPSSGRRPHVPNEWDTRCDPQRWVVSPTTRVCKRLFARQRNDSFTNASSGRRRDGHSGRVSS